MHLDWIDTRKMAEQMSRIVVISDYCTAVPPEPVDEGWNGQWQTVLRPGAVQVTGGYLERLPLAAVAQGWVDHAEIWDFAGRDGQSDAALGRWAGVSDPTRPGLIRRRFRADAHPAPYGSAEALAHIAALGAPEILCVWGIGVDASLLQACAASFKIYNSIDADPLRIPDEVARHFDLFLTGAEWQSDAIRARLPDARTLVLPIGPDFASGETFFPTSAPKDRDVVYVACAQPYKRHDILFDALDRYPRTSALLVIGYGELADQFRAEVAARGLDVEIIGPPGVSHDEVNRQINRAKVGLVCGEHDGAPAILTEYMLAGLPVLANAQLTCGLQYITPDTGMAALPGDHFANTMQTLISSHADYNARDAALDRWSWPRSIRTLGEAIADARHGRSGEIDE